MSAPATSGASRPATPLRPDLAAFFVCKRPAAQRSSERTFNCGILRELAELGLIR